MCGDNNNMPVFIALDPEQVPVDAELLPMPELEPQNGGGYIIASFILAVLSIFPCLCVFSAPLSITGLVLAALGFRKGTNRKAMGVCSIILNVIALLISIAFMVLSVMTSNAWLNYFFKLLP